MALERYQLPTGGKHVYANLKGPDCDIIYFARHGNGLYDTSLNFLAAFRKRNGKKGSAWPSMQDILNAERIALERRDRGLTLNGSRVRKQLLKVFGNLKEVLLTGGGTETGLWHLQGTAVVEAVSDLEDEEARGGAVEWWDSPMLKSRIQRLADGFNTADLTHEERRKGIPKARVALVNRKLSDPKTVVATPKVSPSYSCFWHLLTM